MCVYPTSAMSANFQFDVIRVTSGDHEQTTELKQLLALKIQKAARRTQPATEIFAGPFPNSPI